MTDDALSVLLAALVGSTVAAYAVPFVWEWAKGILR